MYTYKKSFCTREYYSGVGQNHFIVTSIFKNVLTNSVVSFLENVQTATRNI